MVIKWDKTEERYYIQPNKAKIYIDDARTSENKTFSTIFKYYRKNVEKK